MPDNKATALGTGTVLHATDLIYGVDVGDTTMAPSGTSKRFSPAVVTAALSVFGASGSGHAQGLVPDPGGTAGTTRYLREDATWFTPSGGGGGTPGGSTGQLQYNNAGAFGGAVDWSIGSSGQLTGTPIADPGSPAAGDLWISSGRNTLVGINSGCLARHGGCIWTANGPGTALSNSSAETSILTGFASTTGSLVIPANLLTVGKILRLVWYAAGNITATGLLTFNTYLGAAKVLSGGMTVAVAANTGITLLNNQTSMIVQAVGASGKVIGGATAHGFNSLLGGLFSIYQPSSGSTIAQVTVDTTGSLTIDLKAKWNEVSASDSIQIMGAALFIDG